MFLNSFLLIFCSLGLIGEEYRSMVGDKVEEAQWKGLCANDHWQQMKGIMMESAQDICGMTKGPHRHKETWWWNEEVAEEWKIMQRGLSLQQRKRNRRNV